MVSSSLATSSRYRSRCSDRVTRISGRGGSQHVASMHVSGRVVKDGAVRLMGWVSPMVSLLWPFCVWASLSL